MFTEVSKILVERWRALSGEEKEYYENVARTVDEDRKQHRKTKSDEARIPVRRNKNDNYQQQKLQIPTRPPRKRVRVVNLVTDLSCLYS